MGFWTESSFEPKQNFKFKVKFIVSDKDNGLTIPYYYATEVTKPSFEISQKVYKYLNVQQKYPGNITWTNIELSFIDTVDNTILGALSLMFKLRDLDLNKRFTLTQTSFAKNRMHVKALEIHQLSNENTGENAVEKWILENPWVTSLKQDKLSYDSEEINKITLSIAYDWAYLDHEAPTGEKALPKKLDAADKEVKRQLADNISPAEVQANIEQNVIVKRSNEKGMTNEEALFSSNTTSDAWKQNTDLPDSYIGSQVGNVLTPAAPGRSGGLSANVDEANPSD